MEPEAAQIEAAAPPGVVAGGCSSLHCFPGSALRAAAPAAGAGPPPPVARFFLPASRSATPAQALPLLLPTLPARQNATPAPLACCNVAVAMRLAAPPGSAGGTQLLSGPLSLLGMAVAVLTCSSLCLCCRLQVLNQQRSLRQSSRLSRLRSQWIKTQPQQAVLLLMRRQVLQRTRLLPRSQRPQPRQLQ